MYENGTVEGTLVADDVWFDGIDEVPIFRVYLSNGERREFADQISWEFLP